MKNSIYKKYCKQKLPHNFQKRAEGFAFISDTVQEEMFRAGFYCGMHINDIFPDPDRPVLDKGYISIKRRKRMFEKEAQYYAFDEVKHKQEWYIKHPERSINEDYEDIKKHWGKGAEHGYNKAKEEVKAPYPSYKHLFGESIEQTALRHSNDLINSLRGDIDYAKTIIQDLLNNSDEYARQRAMDFLKEDK